MDDAGFTNTVEMKWYSSPVSSYAVPTIPDSPPITGLLSKCSRRSITVENLPKPKLNSFPSHLTGKCFTEFLALWVCGVGVWVGMCMCGGMCVCGCACGCVGVRVCVGVCVCVCACVYVCACMCCVYVYMYVCVRCVCCDLSTPSS